MANVEFNNKAPDIEIDDFRGEKFKLSDFNGKSNVLVVLNRGFA
jgi:peroxiredoxin